MTLLGLTKAFDGGVMHFAPDLANTLARGDASYLALLDEADAFADAFVARNGLDPAGGAGSQHDRTGPALRDRLRLSLNLAEAGIASIIWATGFAVDDGWLKVDAFDENGRPKHQRGVSAEPGICFLGLPWLSRRGSSFIWGVRHKAKYLADHTATQRKYMAYHASA